MKVVLLHIPDGDYTEMEDLRYVLSTQNHPNYEFIITNRKIEAIDKQELVNCLKDL